MTHFIVLDLEATCWLGAPPNNVQEIIEIGALKIDSYGSELGSFNMFVRPYVNPRLSAYCQELTSISQDFVDRADLFPRVIDQFQNWIDDPDADYQLVVWGPTDIQMLQSDCDLHRLESDWLGANLDLKKQYAALNGLNKPAGLKRALRMEGLEFEGQQHRAIDDAINTSRIFINHLDEWQY